MEENKRNTLSLSCPAGVKKDLSQGKIRQSFSRGRSKVVTVEVKKKRAPLKGRASGSLLSSDLLNSGLTKEEVEKRLKVVQESLKTKNDAPQPVLETEKYGVAFMNDEPQVSDLSPEDEKAEEALVAKEEELASAEEEVIKEPGDVSLIETKEPAESEKTDSKFKKAVEPKKNAHYKVKGRFDDDDFKPDFVAKKVPIKKDIKELKGRYSGPSKISIYDDLDEERERSRSLSAIKRARQKHKGKKNLDDVKIIREVVLPDTISVSELSNRMAVRAAEVIKKLIKLGVMATVNQVLDADTAELVVLEFGHTVKRVSDCDIEIGLKVEDKEVDLISRPPVVTIMGHVDHGKTSLLDALRKTDVALNEAGGITQGIGAYQVMLRDGRRITFIDTPGHAAFTEMRSRGANVTDVVVLIVAADDSVKEQTIEAISHAKAAGVPIVVAINKIDKPGAKPDIVRKDLLNHEIVVESFGGDVIDVEISAKTGQNLDKLEDAILLQSEVLDLKANPNRMAEGVVIEAKVERGLGPVATILIQKGTLHVGDIFVSGVVYGRVRAIYNDKREKLDELTPGAPGEIIGFNGSTVPGDDFVVVESEARAKEIASYRDRKKREQLWAVSSKKTLEQMFSSLDKKKILSLIIKSDVQGSNEALKSSLEKFSNDEVKIQILHSGTGEITESDASLAKASNAMIIGFNVRANAQAREQIANDSVEVRYYSIIYDLLDDMKALVSGLLAPEIKEKVLGSAEVRKVFDVSKIGRIAGCMVLDGLIKRSAKARLIRNGTVICTVDIKSLKRQKDDAKEVRSGFECGISLENYNDIHLNDIIECFELEEVARTL